VWFGRVVGRRGFAPAACLLWGQSEIWLDGVAHLVGPRWALAAAAAAASAALWWRRDDAVATTAVIAAAVAPGLLIWGGSQTTATLVPGVVAVYTAGRRESRPLAYVAPALGAALVLGQQATDPLTEDVAGSWGWMVLAVVPFLVGAWLRQRDEVDRRRDAEEQERLRAAKAEERVRIARDVHDVLAHSIGVMVVQAEAASEVLRSDPSSAERALRAVHDTGRAALGDVRNLLSVLREGEPDLVPASTSLDDAEALVARLRVGGLDVDFSRTGPEVDGASSLAAYRILQEALTNVLKHAGNVPTRARIESTARALTVSVENDGPVVAGISPGHGLVGMRERVICLGGELTAGPRREGGFRVRASIPRAGG